jgi:hypothetical protein
VYDAEIMALLRLAEAGQTDLPTITLSESYLKTSGQIARQRIVEAGFRLGAVLKGVAK